MWMFHIRIARRCCRSLLPALCTSPPSADSSLLSTQTRLAGIGSHGRDVPKRETIIMNVFEQNLETGNLELVELVQRAQQGDRVAFGELFERFERHVLAIAIRRLGDFAEAQELCQDVFIQALTKIGQLRQPEAFAGWLRSITNRMAINRVVRKAHDQPLDSEALELNRVVEETPLEFALEDERKVRVREGLAQLGEVDRETLEAFYVRGQSLVEMADEFDAPLGTIKRRLHVARKRLAKHVEELVAV
jgi:RNA polymerase sigma-70 factor (ECF subfamily)